jgi:hypothetical protein
MFEFLKNIFRSNKIPSVSFYSFYQKIVEWNKSKVYPFPYNLPQAISFSPDFWEEVIKIYKVTLKDGKERAISVFWADGELILTSVVQGDEKSVTSKHSVNVRYIPHPTKKEYFRKEVMIDGRVEKRKDIYYKKAPKKIEVQYIFNMHTHPEHEQGYSFFSKQDIDSLLSSGAILTGLVTDKLWILVRTSDTPEVCRLEEKNISPKTLREDMKLGVYCAEFNRNAVREDINND